MDVGDGGSSCKIRALASSQSSRTNLSGSPVVCCGREIRVERVPVCVGTNCYGNSGTDGPRVW